jgi:type IX secretion system PorP/SprF family membrane protein
MAVKKHHRQLLVGLALACGICGARAQDASFSQPYAAPLYLNPAYSGVAEFSRIGASFRYQWAQLGEPYTTTSFYADHYFSGFKSGVGFSAVSDRQAGGAMVNSVVGASYAYNLRLAEKTFMRFGIQASLGVASANAAKLVFPDMLNPSGAVLSTEPYASEQRTYFDMAVGGVFSHGIFFAGAAMHHLMGSPSVEVLGQPVVTPRKLTLHAGCNIPVSMGNSYSSGRYYQSSEDDALTLSPNIIYWMQGVYSAYAAGAYANVRGFSLGFFYKSEVGSSTNFFSAAAGYGTNLFSLMYSFDFGKLSSETKSYMPDTHEISLLFKIKPRARNTYMQQWNTPYKVQNMPIL